MPAWLRDAIFYEIYPQSFYDTNGDGIGDIEGIIRKLDYVRDLGCNALWINPCFDSPFKDAGYDVRDYKKVAPRYGTNDDLYRLFDEAHKKNIHVLLDLVPGHTSEEHQWFIESKKAEKNEYSDRYVWTNCWIQGIAGHPYIGGEADRDGCYMLNFFKCQPALNYGFLNRTQDWQLSPDDPACIATREAMKDVMRFWLDHGCDGFRVDMADSLVKDDDENKSATGAIWKNIREMLDNDYPEAAIISEWSNPSQALKSGFHADFYLDHHGNGYNTLLRDYETAGGDHSFLKKDGKGDIMRFLNDYLPKYDDTKDDGYISFITCNHDTPRPRRTLDMDELKLAIAMFLTLPGVPFIYYGDEIGMRYQKLTSKEGGYQRTGSRTPMQRRGCQDPDFCVLLCRPYSYIIFPFVYWGNRPPSPFSAMPGRQRTVPPAPCYFSLASVRAMNFSMFIINRSCMPSPIRPASSLALTLNTSLRPSTSVSSLSQVMCAPIGLADRCDTSSFVPTVLLPSSM